VGATLDTSDVSRRTRKGRANYPASFKQQIVAEATAPGVSVARVAQRHQLNTNMVFRWIREDEERAGSRAPMQLVEVVTAPSSALPVAAPVQAPATPAIVSPPPGVAIEVVFPAAVVRIQGDASATALRSVFQALARLS